MPRFSLFRKNALDGPKWRQRVTAALAFCLLVPHHASAAEWGPRGEIQRLPPVQPETVLEPRTIHWDRQQAVPIPLGDGRESPVKTEPQNNGAPASISWGAAEGPSVRLVSAQEEVPPQASDDPELLSEEDIVPLPLPGGMGGACAAGGNCGTGSGCGCWVENCQARTRLGRFFCGVYHGICCPDPCYDPQWTALADSAFYTEAARPVTQSRFRWDAGLNMILPDRAEYFWARSGGGGRGRPAIESALDYHDLTHYTEVAHGNFSAFTEVAYRSLDPEVNTHSAGFGDLVAGTKSMLFDCRVLQITMQTKFITPTGNSSKGFGTGHLSIEPSLIFGVNLGPQSYLQAQVAQWIPIAGGPDYAGAVLHYHAAYNRTLFGSPHRVHVIGSFEINGWSFQDGAFSDPVLGQFQQASGTTYLTGAAGLRTVICDKIDFGVGFSNALTDEHFADQLFRSEFRVRF